MSDDDRDIDVDNESDGEDSSDSRHLTPRQSPGNQYYSQAEKRAHHNALERKRRDHIKDSFTGLRDSVPSLMGEKVASRALILKKAAEYIISMKRANVNHQQDIDNLKHQNKILEDQIRVLERSLRDDELMLPEPNESGSETSGTEEVVLQRRPKKMKYGN